MFTPLDLHLYQRLTADMLSAPNVPTVSYRGFWVPEIFGN